MDNCPKRLLSLLSIPTHFENLGLRAFDFRASLTNQIAAPGTIPTSTETLCNERGAGCLANAPSRCESPLSHRKAARKRSRRSGLLRRSCAIRPQCDCESNRPCGNGAAPANGLHPFTWNSGKASPRHDTKPWRGLSRPALGRITTRRAEHRKHPLRTLRRSGPVLRPLENCVAHQPSPEPSDCHAARQAFTRRA